jgi:hypothetical protein
LEVKNIPMPIRTGLLLAALAALAVVAHAPLRVATLDLLHADYAPTWIVAEEMSRGIWSAFLFDMHYAGLVLTAVRALLLKIVSLGGGGREALLGVQVWFGHAFVPVLMALVSFWSVRRVVSLRAAGWTALVVALGFRYIHGNLQNDVYTMNFLFATWVLGFRATRRFPLLELGRGALFALGVLSGLMLYNSRMTLIPLVVLWAPPIEDWKSWFSYFVPRDRIACAVRAIAVGLAALYVYLDFFGSTLGTFHGRRVMLSAPPNLKIAAVLMILIALRNGALKAALPHLGRVAPVAIGAIAGFLPELVHNWNYGGIPPRGTEQWRALPGAIEVLAKVPSIASEVVADPSNVLSVTSRVLWFAGAIGMVSVSRRDRRFQPAILLLGLGLLAFCMIQNYAGANARYLLPIFPALIFGMAWLFERVLPLRPAVAAAIALVCLHAGAVVGERKAVADEATRTGLWNEHLAIGRIFREAGVRVVGCDYYWNTNTLSLANAMNPEFFELEGYGLYHQPAVDLWKTEPVVGVVISMPESAPEGKTYRGRRIHLVRELGQIGANRLYLAETAKE